VGPRHRSAAAARRGGGANQIEDLIQRRGEVQVERQIAASPATVFSYLVEPAKFVAWMGTSAELDPRPGGRFRIEVDRGNVAVGEYQQIDPPHRLVLTWGWERSETVPPGSTTIEITLAPQGSGTLFRLRHLGLPDEGERASHHEGWAMYSERLAALFDGAR
jgi:uncharacterized protein YndB with AHSA1/START domain